MVATLVESPPDNREDHPNRSAERRVLLVLLYESDMNRVISAACFEAAQSPNAVFTVLAASGSKTLAGFAAISGVPCSEGLSCAQALLSSARASLPPDARVYGTAVAHTLRRAVCDALSSARYDVVVVPRNGTGRRCRSALERWSRGGGTTVIV